jgi:hypothetical protein
MRNAMPKLSSYAALFDPMVAREAAARAAQWNLPRHECHPLDHYAGRRVNSALAAYDEAVDMAPVAADEIAEEVERDSVGVAEVADDTDFDDEEF